ncbi:23S rRNA pseudouridine(2605) synthase RluB [Vibrio sp. SS-MA-C1-2]|uniref:23S rRNA pseudouridine(2605) synthase RluB n=1 Tax=Vibrio sp. SS-MA-C1-2 TaxID=2908646 RepID=UPI001F1898BE|nr:23S rRNA pseudouridine(2605) synthase RluB [Vibrio sp. SS-MA-C1-2]UJF19827.1 23S rRNA pseudouridine(2605) synthase RluB [Vibrio sp. SS-MA-C1-2]
MSEKLHKVLARAGHGSRREIEDMIQKGRIIVDGQVAKLGDRLENIHVQVRIDGHNVNLGGSAEQVCRVLAYNKPEGELCTRNDPEGRRTVFDRLPHMKDSRWISVGRLDANTGGLLLFTTDGELANRLMHPKNQIQREYMVRVFGEINDKMVQNLVKGVELEDGVGRFEDVVYAGGEGMNHTFYVVIAEGRNREVRRLWASQGVTVSRLKRVRYGNIFLNSELPRGGWKELELPDVNYLRGLVELPDETETMLIERKDQRKKRSVQQIRRAVRRHEERVDSEKSGRNKKDKQRTARRGQAVAAKPKSTNRRKPSNKPKSRAGQA